MQIPIQDLRIVDQIITEKLLHWTSKMHHDSLRKIVYVAVAECHKAGLDFDTTIQAIKMTCERSLADQL